MSNLFGLGLIALMGFIYVVVSNSGRIAYEERHKDDWKKRRYR